MDTLERAVLDYANDVRKRAGLDPATQIATGTPGIAGNCPVANTIRQGSGLSVTIYRMCFVRDQNHSHIASDDPTDYIVYDEEVPRQVLKFIRYFDDCYNHRYDMYEQ